MKLYKQEHFFATLDLNMLYLISILILILVILVLRIQFLALVRMRQILPIIRNSARLLTLLPLLYWPIQHNPLLLISLPPKTRSGHLTIGVLEIIVVRWVEEIGITSHSTSSTPNLVIEFSNAERGWIFWLKLKLDGPQINIKPDQQPKATLSKKGSITWIHYPWLSKLPQ